MVKTRFPRFKVSTKAFTPFILFPNIKIWKVINDILKMSSNEKGLDKECFSYRNACVGVFHLVSRLWEQLGLRWLFGRLVLLDLPHGLSVGVTRGVLLNHRHPLQHRRPAEREHDSALHD